MSDLLTGSELPLYMPIPYRVDPGEDVTCPHCQLKNDTDASFCDQCGTELVGRDDVVVGDGGATAGYAPEPYDPQGDETVQCPDCQKRNDPDCRFCDQCGSSLVGRTDVKTDGPVEDIDDVDETGADGADTPSTESPAADPSGGEEDQNDDANRAKRARSNTDPPPKENLVRSRVGAGVELRDIDPVSGDSTGSLLFGHFSVFNDWYEIDSYWEGLFLESIAPGAFAQTMVDDRAGMRVLYDHGYDPVLGNKPLGPITELSEDDIGAYYEVPLLDTGYNRDFVLPALQGRLMSGQQVGSQLGASFRFIVLDETWEQKPDPSDFNQLGIPQRVITRAQVLEFGPVTFPASAGASSGVRSQTDTFIDRLHHDPRFLARFTERVGLNVVERMLESMPARGRTDVEPARPATKPLTVGGASVRSQSQRRALARLTTEGVTL